jgi:hypothetical protein
MSETFCGGIDGRHLAYDKPIKQVPHGGETSLDRGARVAEFLGRNTRKLLYMGGNVHRLCGCDRRDVRALAPGQEFLRSPLRMIVACSGYRYWRYSSGINERRKRIADRWSSHQ